MDIDDDILAELKSMQQERQNDVEMEQVDTCGGCCRGDQEPEYALNSTFHSFYQAPEFGN